jgi:hypothetical protein
MTEMVAISTGCARVRAPFQHPDLPGVSLVPLTRGMAALIDECDAEFVGKRLWCANASRGAYYARAGSRKPVWLHRFLWSLWGMPDAPEIYHINGNSLDNRRGNLRGVTHRQNGQNKGGHPNKFGLRGVAQNGRRFCGQIVIDKKRHFLGNFDTPEEAHAAYVKAAKEAYGEFAAVVSRGCDVAAGLGAVLAVADAVRGALS